MTSIQMMVDEGLSCEGFYFKLGDSINEVVLCPILKHQLKNVCLLLWFHLKAMNYQEYAKLPFEDCFG